MSHEQRIHSNFSFRLMALYLKYRERSRKPEETLRGLGISEGHRVLDYGCGIGSYSIPAARLVGKSGQVYALDIHPMAVKRVSERAEREGLADVTTILSGLETGLPAESMDYVLLFDVYKSVSNRDVLLKELHRVLKPDGMFAVIIDHLDPDVFVNDVSESGLFVIDSHDEDFFILRRV